MTNAPLDLAGWTILADAAKVARPAGRRACRPASRFRRRWRPGVLNDAGGILTLVNSANLRVDGVAYLGGDPATGWSTSF